MHSLARLNRELYRDLVRIIRIFGQFGLRLREIKKEYDRLFLLRYSSIIYQFDRDSCLYARNTTRAIIRKSIILGLSCPILNSVVLPKILGTCTDTASRFPAGKNNPIRGFMMSSTKDVTSPEAA